MNRIEKIINDENNIGLDFIVHVQNKEELESLISVLTDNDFKIQMSFEFDKLEDYMVNAAKETNYDTCFRIRNRENDKCVTYNPSIEHWRLFCRDILEIRNGELVFNERDYTKETAKIEANKIFNAINDEDYGVDNLKLFEFEKIMSEEDIVDWLMGIDKDCENE